MKRCSADHSPDSSAERPVQLAEYMIVDDSPPSCFSRLPAKPSSSAALPAGYSEFHRLAFYNIGLDAQSKKVWHTMEGLATEICDMVHDKCVDAVSICEVFNLRDDSWWQQRQDIMEHVVRKLNTSAAQQQTPADSSAERPAWKGQSDGHYIFAWNSNRLVLTTYKYISCGIEEHPWRMAQYLQFKPAKSHYHSPVSLHVCHNHSPASKQGKLIDGRAQRIFATLWGHVMENDRFENVDNAYQPVAVFGGDFNCRPLGWVQCLKHAMAAHKYVCKYTSVQVCTSQTIPRHLGDRAIVFNARATQEDSGWGKSHIRADKPPPFSDDHDVVLVPLCWIRRVLRSTSSAARPAPPSMDDPAAKVPRTR